MVRRLRRLCDLAEDLPKSMELQDIPVCKSTFRPVLTSRSSVYQGELQDRLVAIKSPRWGEEEKRQHHKASTSSRFLVAMFCAHRET
jgi:hypothetical protein